MKIVRKGLLAATLMLMVGGCTEYRMFEESKSTEPTKISEEEQKGEMVFENKVVPFDRLDIRVYNQSSNGQLTSIVTSNVGTGGVSNQDTVAQLVSAQGTIDMPLIGRINVLGMTQFGLQDHLVELYKKYLRNPYVIVEFTNHRIFVIGEVNNPGVVQVEDGTMSLIEAIARSGDITDNADRTNVKVLRGDLRNPQVRVIDLNNLSAIRLSSLYLKPNDIIYVQPRYMKGFNQGVNEAIPTFSLLSSMLNPFVQVKAIKNWSD